ncbi:MAG: ATP-binding protein [Candidatus Tectomicrobia bacterium]|nr:ATP-binding protein [Candidatus Tectomicrobia bacterium]
MDHIDGVDSEIDELQKDLRAKFAADSTVEKIADLRANAGRRLERVTTLRDEYQKKWQALTEAIDGREKIADELVKVQNQIAGIRSRHNAEVEEILNQFLPNWMKVSIGFRAGGDTAIFAEELHKIFGAKGNQPKRIRSLVERYCTPVSFAKMLREGDVSELVGKSGTFEGVELEFTDNDAGVCLERTRPFEHDEFAEIDVPVENGARLEKILGLYGTPWDDHEVILLNGQPVNEKSPGQRSSAMLPLIALAETTPLIIDQPEDNLDKRLIGSVLIKVLAVLKEKRQIIVCTHDPNILVGGDAEQVIVLEAESDRRGKVAQHGSIDNDDIVDTVVDLLEGGAEAFEARQKRYRGRAGLAV